MPKRDAIEVLRVLARLCAERCQLEEVGASPERRAYLRGFWEGSGALAKMAIEEIDGTSRYLELPKC